ncbi:hypothetical protein Hamer_G021771 [Homarus americanus]|uniref:Uncharacterized protein n=1 Tax=Homarus americanus TaxID=6706 RepID=A0A8J5MXT3_HOMAM|nr:hypothetical protein Hamer_G021771 [Homarus americanus]
MTSCTSEADINAIVTSFLASSYTLEVAMLSSTPL